MSLSDSVDIFPVRYNKADLMAVPEDERMFYLLVSSLANDIQILLRQYSTAVKQWEEDQIKRDGSSVVAMLNLRLLAARFHEGWVLIKEKWAALEPSYLPTMSKAGKSAISELHKHFDKKPNENIVYMIRNKIGFHADPGYAKKMFDAVGPDTELVDYIGRSFGDTLYFGSEITHYQALQTITGTSDPYAAFDAVMDETRKLQRLFLDFVFAFMRLFYLRHFSQQFNASLENKQTVTDLPKMNEMRIPFFLDLSENVAAAKASEEDGA